MASFTSSAGIKRVRPWDSCQDAERLKEMLEEREGELDNFKKQKSSTEENVDAVQRLEEMLQLKESRIEQLLLELEKAKAVPSSGKVFNDASMKATPDVLKDKTSTKLHSDIGCVASVRRNESRKGRHVTADSELDVDDDEEMGMANDGDYAKETAAVYSTDDDDVTFGKGKSVRRNASGRKPKANVNECLSYGTQRALNADPSKLRASIRNQIMKQMVYRQGLKYSKSKAVAEVPNLSEDHVKAIVGENLFPKGKSRGKVARVNVSKDEVNELFGDFTKSLRYGAILDLMDGLKFAFARDTGILKVTGTFTMY